MKKMVSEELKVLLSSAVPVTGTVTQQMIDALPSPVGNWLSRSHVIGKPLVETVRLNQTGEMRTTPSGKWMSFDAEQHIVANRPGFLWFAHVKTAPLLHLAGRDKYVNGKGHMLIRFLSLFTVVDVKGPAIDRGALIRFLAEIVWFPTAALSDSIQWQQLDSSKATATIRDGDLQESVTFNFSLEGDVESIDAMRHYDRKTGATLEKWHVENDLHSFREFEGIRIPTRSAVTWKLQEGDFTWLRLEIRNVYYNTD